MSASTDMVVQCSSSSPSCDLSLIPQGRWMPVLKSTVDEDRIKAEDGHHDALRLLGAEHETDGFNWWALNWPVADIR